MRGLTRFFLSVGAVALLAGPALAQRGGGFFGGGMGSPALLIQNKGVQKEIKLDDAQAQKAESLAREKMEGMREKFQGIPKEQRKEKGQQVMRETNAEVNKALADILKPEQKKRFDQIVLQQRGAQGLTDDE